MPMIEKDLADALIDLRLQHSLGTEYAPMVDMIAAVQAHLDREMWWRARLAELAAEGES